MGADIRVALDLVATTSGAGSITSLIYALSQLNMTGDDLTAKYHQLEQAGYALSSSELGLEQATSRVNQAYLSSSSASERVVAARRDVQTATDAATESDQIAYDAEHRLNTMITMGSPREVIATQQVTVAKAQQAAQTADNTRLAAEEQLQIAQNSAAYADEAVNVANLGEEAAQQRMMVASLNEEYIASQVDAAEAGNAAMAALTPIIGIAIAAAAETLAFDEALKTVIGDASAIQYTSAQMNLALHGSTEEMKQLDTATISWAENSLYSTAQVHQLTTELAEHGLTTKQILDGVGQAAIQLGEAINTDPVPAADLLASTMQIFSSQGMTAKDTANMLTAAFYNGVGSASELQQAYDMVGGQMVAAGGTAQDLTANIDLLAQAGLSGSTAGSSLRYVLQSMTAPTTAQANAMNYLGLTVVNTTSPAFEKLKAELDASGKAGRAAVSGFDGTSVGLRNMFTAAQKLHLIPLNETFNQWSVASGAMSTKFYDAKGNFVGLGNSISDVITAIQKKAHGNKDLELNLIESMFNVRSGRAVGILASMTNYKDKYNGIIKEIGKTSVSKDANSLLDTLQGRWNQLKTTFSSTAGQIGTTLLPMLSGLVLNLNNLLGSLQKNHPQILQFLAIFIAVGAVLAPLVVVIGVIIILFSLFSEVLIPLGIALAVIPLVGALVAGIITQIHTKGTPLYNLFQKLQPLIQLIGHYFGMLGQVWQTQILPNLATLLPILKIVGIIIGVVIVAALGLAVLMFLVVVGAITLVILIIAKLVQGIGWLIGHIGDAWNLVKTNTQETWTLITTAITNAWNLVTTNIGESITLIKTALSNAWNLVVTNVKEAGQLIVGSFKTAWNLVTTNMHNVWNGITSFFTSLPATAQTWGKNIIQGFITGINNMVANVKNAAGNIAQGVKSMIGFASPSEEGPGRTADQWAPNLMKMYAQGITGNIGLVANAASGVAGVVRTGLTTPGSLSGAGGAGGTQVYNVNVGNQPLFQMVMNQLTGQLQINGFGRAWR